MKQNIWKKSSGLSVYRSLRNMTLMVVGAGLGQLPAILTAKKMGLKVVVIDRNSKALGMKQADIALPIDVIDIDKAVKAAKKYKISGVMTMQTDLPVPTIGAIIDALGLNGVGFKVAKRCSDKWKMRKCFYEYSVSTPKAFLAGSVKEAQQAVDNLGFPCIIKPADSSASRGVTKLDSKKQIVKAFKKAFKYSRTKRVCLEQFIEGLEIGAQTFSLMGKCKAVYVHNDTVSNPPFYIPVGHSFPSLLASSVFAKVEKECKKAIEALGINNGPANIDIIVDKTGQPFIIEIGARIGATCLPELMFYYTGIDWVKASILVSLGQTPNLKIKQNIPCAALILESPKDGKLINYYIPDKVRTMKGLLELEVTAQKGEFVGKLRKGTDRIGKIVVKDKTVEAAEKKAKYIKSQIKFKIK